MTGLLGLCMLTRVRYIERTSMKKNIFRVAVGLGMLSALVIYGEPQPVH